MATEKRGSMAGSLAGSGWEDAIAAACKRLEPLAAIQVEVPQEAPDSRGAYLLFIALDQPLQFVLGRRVLRFGPGLYVYAGSARGPGGIRARLARHFRREKKLHWHVDRLTAAAARLSALAIAGGEECDVAARLAASRRFVFAHPGFGSSDCRTCESHLLGWHETAAPGGLPSHRGSGTVTP
jgi:Uri superfamily endonuclease